MVVTNPYLHLSTNREHPHKDVSGHCIDQRYKEIVGKWTRHLQYTSWQFTRDKQVAEDIVQEAFMVLWQQKDKIVHRNPAGWLIKVVTNLSIRHLRDRNMESRNHKHIFHTRSASSWEVEEKLLHKEQELIFENVVNQLPKQQKIVFLLSNEKGLKRREIALFLRLSPNTVKVHLARATQFMKEHLTCISIYLLIFVLYNFILKDSNTIQAEVEQFRKNNLDNTSALDNRKEDSPDKLFAMISFDLLRSANSIG